MRLLRLHDDTFAVDLHPYVTVVHGLGPEQRATVIRAVTSLPRAEVDGFTGLVEAHGVVFDLTTETLELLELRTDDLEPVVTIAELPGQGDSAARRELQARERRAEVLAERVEAATADAERHRVRLTESEAELERAQRVVREAEDAIATHEASLVDLESAESELADAVDRARAEVEACERELLERRDRLADVERGLLDAQRVRDEVVAERTALAARLESAEVARDPLAEADVTAAEEAFEAAQEALEAERRGDEPDGADTDHESDDVPDEPVETRLARLEVQRTELDARLAVLGGADTVAVETALAGLSGGDEPVLVPSADAASLADELQQVERELAASPEVADDDVRAISAARQRLDAARRALAEAEQEVRQPELDRDDIDALELAHADVLDAQEKGEGRFAGQRAERRIEEARRVENELLDRLGFASYADYMMGTSILHVDDEREASLDAARTELADAEDAWAIMQSGVDDELGHAALVDRRRVLAERASSLLGGDQPDDLVGALRELRVPAEVSGDGRQRLAAALQAVGLAVDPDELEVDDLVLLAEEWLAEERAANARRDEVLVERAGIDAQISSAVSQLSQAAAGMPGPSEEARLKARVDDARAALDAARERLRRHREADEEVGELRAALGTTDDRASQLDDDVVAAESAVTTAQAEVAGAEHDLARAEGALGSAESARGEFEHSSSADHGVELAQRHQTAIDAAAQAEARVAAARSALAGVERKLDTCQAEHREVVEAVQAARSLTDDAVPEAPPASEEVEWYLLSRLAAQRRVSFAGSVPLVIDEALDVFADDDVIHVLERLERMAAAVQLIVVTDHESVIEWGRSLGDGRGAAVTAVAPDELAPLV